MKIIRKFFGLFSSNDTPGQDGARDRVVVARGDHAVSRKKIDPDALKVLNRLNRFKHSAYLVGGGVRDLLLDRPAKDFDIATSAHPNEVKKLFRNCRLVGRRFRLAHILFRGRKVIEVSTFRRHAGFGDDGDLLIKSDNTFGTAEEDALRRDFTVNGLFYNIADFTVIDYVGGLEDLKNRVITTIGDPAIRFREDPIRMLRAIRFAARLDFKIAERDLKALAKHRKEIWKGAVQRILEDILRMTTQGAAAESFRLLEETGLLGVILPRLARGMKDEETATAVIRNLQALDERPRGKEELPPSFIAALLYLPVFYAALREAPAGANRLDLAASILEEDLKKLHFPKMQFERAKQMMATQYRIENVNARNNRSGQLVRKGYLPDALALFEMTRPRSRENRAVLRRWQTLMKDAGSRPSSGGGRTSGGGRGRRSGGGGGGGPRREESGKPSRSRRRRRGPRKPSAPSPPPKPGKTE